MERSACARVLPVAAGAAFLLVIVSACSGGGSAPAPVVLAPDASADGARPGGGTGATGAPGGGGPADGGLLPDGAVRPSDGGGRAVDGALASDGGASLPPPSACGRIGDACKSIADCCSGLCDTGSKTCVSSLQMCAGESDACAAPTDCCNLHCRADETCDKNACVSDADACSDDEDCCGRSCVDGACAALNLECRTSGNACSDSTQCCSGLCKDDRCQLAASFCIQEGDICARATDCCTGRCDIAADRDVGVCGPPPSGASFCSDGIEGSVCGACNECCSRLCAPYGPTGVNVCQPASGCHVTGDFCRSDKDCCGHAGTGLPGEGHVTCQKEAGSDLGICRNPNACNPQGNVCHFKDYMCDVSSARANCCGGLGAKGGVCQLDGLGVPRCNGLGDECIPSGGVCASADDCCDGLPCVPNDEGELFCYDPPGSEPCVPAEGPCTINADCCPGGTCVRPVGSTDGTCTPTEPPPPDGGTGKDAGTTPECAEYGQICDTGADCCNDVPCTNGICRVPFG